MSYIKIHKDLLDYHYYAKFHAFTMNNFIRSVMRKGKYKKATKLVRLGLIVALKRIRMNLDKDYVGNVIRNFRRMRHTVLSENTKNQFPLQLEAEKLAEKASWPLVKTEVSSIMKDNILTDTSAQYYLYLIKHLKLNELSINKGNSFIFSDSSSEESEEHYAEESLQMTDTTSHLRKNRKFSFFRYYNSLSEESIFTEAFDNLYKEQISNIYEIDSAIDPLTHLHFQHQVLSKKLKFRKLYTKKPKIFWYRHRSQSVFDLIHQAYMVMTSPWHMRKIKVSGRTVLVPSPLRSYRRITNITKMILKGIRQLRRSERTVKKAMIESIGAEFFFLGLYFTKEFKHPNITASYAWQLKLKSHKELVANLKNMKYMHHY